MPEGVNYPADLGYGKARFVHRTDPNGNRCRQAWRKAHPVEAKARSRKYVAKHNAKEIAAADQAAEPAGR